MLDWAVMLPVFAALLVVSLLVAAPTSVRSFPERI